MINWQIGELAEKWIPVLNKAEVRYKVPYNLCARQCFEESAFQSWARNSQSGAVGLMQLLPKYFPGAGPDPVKDIDTGVQYLAHLWEQFKDWQLALAAYNWGPGNIRKWLKSGKTFIYMPPETQKYVTQIIGDVPVAGALCKIPSLPSSPETGFQPSQSLGVTPLAASSPSWSARLSSLFTRKELTTIQLRLPSQPSVPLSVVTLSRTENQGVNSMTQANPVLVAAAPAIINVLNAVKQFAVDLGPDPAKYVLTVPGAFEKLLGTAQLQVPVLAAAEGAALQTAVGQKVDELIAKLQAALIQQAPAAVQTPATAPSQAV